MDTKARHIVKNLYKFYKCHHNCLKLLKSRFVHNMNPSFRSVWVYNLTNGIPGNSTDVQLASLWLDRTHGSYQRSLGQSAQGKVTLGNRNPANPSKTQGWVCHCSTCSTSCWGPSTGTKGTYRAARTTAFLVWGQLHWKPPKASCPQCQGTQQLRHSLCTTQVSAYSAN